MNYYELLHVQPTAPAPVIKASYRAMMQKLNHHPDRGGNVAFAQQLNDAVNTLCHPERRSRYDAKLKARMAASPAQAAEKHRQNDRKPSSDREWGEPGGSPQRSETDQSDVGSESADSYKHAGTDSGKNAHGADGYQTRSATGKGSDQSCSSLPALGTYCLFCKAKLSEPDNTYQGAGDYASFNLARCQRCDGATTPITMLHSASNEELRKLYRLNYSADALVWTHWADNIHFSSRLCDFSPLGCSCLSKQALVIDQVLMIDTLIFNAICKVRHVKKTDYSSYLIGLEFLTLDIQGAPGTLLHTTA